MPWPPPSTLPDAPFPNRALAAVAAAAEGLLAPGYWTLDRLLALRPTTAQRARWSRRRAGLCLAVGARVLAAPALVLALLLALPPALLGLLLWLPAQAKRRPFVHQRAAAAAAPEPWDPRSRRGFTFLSANLCLLTGGLARFSNLGNTRRRAEAVGRLLAPGAPAERSGRRDGLLEQWRGEGRGYGGTEDRDGDSGMGMDGVDPWMVAGAAAPAANATMWAGMPTADPTAMADRMPMDNPMSMAYSTPVADPMSMANPTLMVDPMPMANPTPMAKPAPMADSMSMANPTLTANLWPTAASAPTPELPMTDPTSGPAPSPMTDPGPERPIPLPDPMPPVLTTRIPPDVDFLCLQEVFDAAAAAALRRRLGRRFPHVLWGVGPGGLRCGRLRVMGSGLLLASRFPPLAARFHAFPNGAREDALANKGLLVAQVLLGTGRGRRVVGYLGCTHLQAPAADATIRDVQLSLVLRWLREFRREQEQRGDLVAFDVLCGDVNFDNCSRGDAQNQQHPLFKEFWDPARREAGQDQPWAIGTLLDCLKIYEEPVSTPEKMERTLSHPWGRQQFLAGPILSCGALDPMAPRPWQGRRVDVALLRRDPELSTEVTRYSVITQLATLTDHLPVALRLRLGPADL
ncbi:sphingomyelin phosphodiesterase 5-like [Cinclus cinclus]|uniref:sphingomyelin phosphodiesterase 5-like n=1 Tax=Cinclus cinclus TaxID=127875 RepID=UPI002E132913